MGQAFISYSRKDSVKVYAICEILADAGYSYWLDKEDIPPPEQWRAEIVDGIKNSDSFILFISPASLNSPNVIKELNIASEQEHKGALKIIPVLLTPTEIPKEAEYQLSGKQWVDLSVNFTKGLEDLIKTLGAFSLPKGYKKHLLNYLPGTYITPELISPLTNPSQEIVIGKTINIKQIRDQRFMPRPRILANALRELDVHVKEREKNRNEEIFTFWIHGRSGSGKSVLLLQLLQEMVLQRQGQVFWFYSDETEKLYDFIEKWAEQGIDLDKPVFIFTDDFNTPLTRDLAESRSISSLLRNPSYSEVNWPMIVTCSPPEYLEDFRNGGKDEGFRIKKWEIPTIGADESKQLIQWFEARTGKKPKTGKAFEQSEGLALSMLFELWYNAQYQNDDKNEDVMKAFGQRFKTRLDALNLTEIIAPILALNRLYLWPPNSWLEEMTPDQRDAFNILIHDKDFEILTLEKSPSGFLRLTHPHLSDVIYQAIRPKNTTRITRAHDLAFTFEKALDTNIFIANQILRTVAEKICDEKDRLASDDINGDELAKLFTKIWNHQNAIGEDTKGLLIYAWINWAVWNSKNPQISNYLNEDNIIEKNLYYLDYQHKLWGELWQNLWSCEPQNRQLVDSAISWLSQHQDSPSWSFVWQILLEHPNDLPEGTSIHSLIQLGLQWLSGREDKGDWSFVWRALLEHPDTLPKGTSIQSILQLGLQWLEGREDKDQWSFVWRTLLEHPTSLPDDTSVQSILQLSLQWLEGREDKDQWSFVWCTLLEHPTFLPDDTSIQSILQLGLQWLEGREEKDQWSFVWRALLEHPNDMPEGTSLQSLIQLGIQWLEGREEKDQWAFVWRALLEHPNDMPEGTSLQSLIQLGIQWLEGREEKDQWSFVWRALLEHPNDLPDDTSVQSILQLSLQWLEGREDKDQWSFVWRTLLEHPNSLPDDTSIHSILQLGSQWLEGREDKDQWAFVWQTLLEHPNSLPDDTSIHSILQLGLQWLEGREDKDQWSFVWERIFKNRSFFEKTQQKRIFKMGLLWLRTKSNKDDWPFIWEGLLKAKQVSKINKEELLILGQEWLNGKENHQSWSFVFETCLQNHVVTQELLSRGIQWVFSNENRKETPGIAFEIVNYFDRIVPSEGYRVHEWIRDWVYQSHPKNKGWSYGWAAYWKIMPAIETVDLALKWIEVNPEYTDGTRWIVNTLIREERPDINLRLSQWLDKHPSHPISEVIKKKLQL